MQAWKKTHTIKVGISPCPNDTFAFYHLLDLQQDLPFKIELIVADVEELNTLVIKGELDISKVSFHLFGNVVRDYMLLRSGSAMGMGCGPLVLARDNFTLADIATGSTALPGRHTTAAMLFSIFMADHGFKDFETVYMNFAEIPDAISSGDVDAGVVIHESRFTYREKGLQCLHDLGVWWEDTTGMPIPLGGIIARRSLEMNMVRVFDSALRNSIEYAHEHPEQALEFSAGYAQEMAPDIIKHHVSLYVNDFTLNIGKEGEAALRFMLEYGARHGIFQENVMMPDLILQDT